MLPAQSVPTPPTAPPAPGAAPTVPTPPFPSTPGEYAAPRTAADVAGLRARSLELQNQLRATQRRRADLAHDIRRAEPFAMRGALETEMTRLDDRVLQLQTDAATTDRLITSAPPALLAATSQPRREFLVLGPNGPSANAVPVLLIVVIILQLLAFVRGRGRRVSPAPPDPVLRDAAARLARVEEAVDAIAVEVERVSEGQRYVTRVLGEPRPHETVPRGEATEFGRSEYHSAK